MVAGVKISADHGTLRLRWSHGGKRYQMSVGLADTPANRRALAGRVAQIERDIAYGEFDPTLEAYRTSEAPRKKKEPEISHLWRAWIRTKKNLGVKTLQWMSTMEKALENCPHKMPSEARLVKLWLMDNVAPRTAHRTLQNLSAMGRWAIDQQLLEKNPFEGMCNSVKVPRADDENTIDPFTLAERHAILQAYQEHPDLWEYAFLIQFLFLTGCRPSEAFGLRWSSVGKTRLVIRESAVQVKSQMIHKEGTKTEKMRHFPVGPELEHFIGQLRRGAPTDPVFTKDGKPMVYNYFLRSWGGYIQKGVRYGGIVRKLADEGHIERYRSPYQCRHTMITQCLEAGVPLVQLARWVGNSPEILLKHYAGVLSSVEVPTLLAEDPVR